MVSQPLAPSRRRTSVRCDHCGGPDRHQGELKSSRIIEPPFLMPVLGLGPALICDMNHAASGLPNCTQKKEAPTERRSFTIDPANAHFRRATFVKTRFRWRMVGLICGRRFTSALKISRARSRLAFSVFGAMRRVLLFTRGDCAHKED
jgi:hypothetical protein